MDEIKKEVDRFRFSPAGVISENIDRSGSYYVPIEHNFDSKGKSIPSRRALISAKRDLKKKGYDVSFILINSKLDLLEKNIRETIFSAFPDFFRNLFISMQEGEIVLWIEPKHAIDEKTKSRIDEILQVISKFKNLKRVKWGDLSDYDLPTGFEILKEIKLAAPVSLPALGRRLETKGLKVPTESWILNKVELLKKSKLAMTLNTGEIVLTWDGLIGLGSTKGRESLDIRRMLEINKRRN